MNDRLSGICVVCLCGVIAAALNTSGRTSTADDEPKQNSQTEHDKWMAVKLTSAQQILEHLTSANFEQLETSARRMQVLNFLEQWQREENFKMKSDYQGQINAFEFSTKELIRHAGDKNIDGALTAYVALTESCVRCHKLIRDIDNH